MLQFLISTTIGIVALWNAPDIGFWHSWFFTVGVIYSTNTLFDLCTGMSQLSKD